MNPTDRLQCLHIYLAGGLDLTNLPFATEAQREEMIETCWDLILEGNQLGIPPHKTVQSMVDELREIQQIGPEEYNRKYHINPDRSG